MANANEAAAERSGDDGAVYADGRAAWPCSCAAERLWRPSRLGMERLRELAISGRDASVGDKAVSVAARPEAVEEIELLPLGPCVPGALWLLRALRCEEL